jgi:hypothetical protein
MILLASIFWLFLREYFLSVPVVFFPLFWGYLIWSIVAWFRSKDPVLPKWRSYATALGLLLAAVSTILDSFLYIHAKLGWGGPPFSSLELLSIQPGGLTALLGIVCGIAGKGKPRVAVIIIASITLFLWVMTGMAH